MAEEVKNELVEKKERVNMVANLENGIYSSSDTFNLAYQMAKGLSQSITFGTRGTPYFYVLY